MGAVPSELVQLRNLTLPPEINVLSLDCTAEYQADPYWSGVYAALRQNDPAVCPPDALESFGWYKREVYSPSVSDPAGVFSLPFICSQWH